MNEFVYVDEQCFVWSVTPAEMDIFLAEGWRHVGRRFFRYSSGFYDSAFRHVAPLRIRLANFSLSKSQRRTLKKNRDLQIVVRAFDVTPEMEELFEKHKRRFIYGVPESIYNFLPRDAGDNPCEALEICVYRDGELLAVSFFDVGERAVSSVYAIFAPEETSRRLGIFTMLLEIEWALENKKEFFYQGYCFEEDSFYDYKKRFRGVEKFDWNGNWENF
jgi:arginine-tRNA-protein transferase